MALFPVALIGGAITLAVLWPLYGSLIALACVPFGGSLLFLLANLLAMFLQARAEWKREREPKMQPSCDSVPAPRENLKSAA